MKKIKEEIKNAITQEGFIQIYIMVVLTFLLGVFLGALLYNNCDNTCKTDTIEVN